MRLQWHRLDHMQIICTLLQTNNHADTLLLNFFYKPDALPDAKPTVSKHWRHIVDFLVVQLGNTTDESLAFPKSECTNYISKGMSALKLFCNRILRFITGVLANTGCTCIMAIKQLCVHLHIFM